MNRRYIFEIWKFGNSELGETLLPATKCWWRRVKKVYAPFISLLAQLLNRERNSEKFTQVTIWQRRDKLLSKIHQLLFGWAGLGENHFWQKSPANRVFPPQFFLFSGLNGILLSFYSPFSQSLTQSYLRRKNPLREAKLFLSSVNLSREVEFRKTPWQGWISPSLFHS